ncbi:MAG: hypothetical protein HRU20_29170 [Pseudomonadales bacterium]|nr:hypothetical protein [Pseudomonadales bacterium]
MALVARLAHVGGQQPRRWGHYVYTGASIKQLITIIFIMLSGLSFSEEAIDISLNKLEFTVSDNFLANLTNVSKKETTYIGLSVQVMRNGDWKLTRTDTGCPCRSKCKKKATTLQINGTSSEAWDFKDNMCNTVLPGKYRAVLLGRWDSILNSNIILGSSGVFTIK